MSSENQSLRRRIDALEARLANQERASRAESTRSLGWKWPRERWLGRTTSTSVSSYPASGDTFQVELLSGHFTATEGTQAVTESLRGTTPIARTWPATYLPYGTEVIAERIRGLGPSGSGEWWIQPTGGGGYDRCVMAGRGGGAYKYDGTQRTDPLSIVYGDSLTGGNADYGVWSFPYLTGKHANSGGVVFSQRTPAGSSPPTAWDDWWLECHAFTTYRITIHTTWELARMSDYHAEYYVKATDHYHSYTDNPGAVYQLTGKQRWSGLSDTPMYMEAKSVVDRPVTVVTEILPSYGSRSEMGRSTMPLWYHPDSYRRFATHSGTAIIDGHYRPGPITVRIRHYRTEATPEAIATIYDMSVTVEQSSDPYPADP